MSELEDKVMKYCGNCRYSEPSFYLLWCYRLEQDKTALDTCGEWESKESKAAQKPSSWWWK